MTSFVIKLNNFGFSRLDFRGEGMLQELQRSIDGAKHWLIGAAQEAAISWFSRVHGTPVPESLSRALGGETHEAVAAPTPVRQAEAAYISSESQWAMTRAILASATSSADAAGRLQEAASEQIDAASYALDRLLEELGPVMIFTRPDDELVVRRYEPAAPRRAPAAKAQPARREAVQTAAA